MIIFAKLLEIFFMTMTQKASLIQFTEQACVPIKGNDYMFFIFS